jgi:hypothetical protein
MKTVNLLSVFLSGTLLLSSCNQPNDPSTNNDNESDVTFALAKSESKDDPFIETESAYLYVTASTGLSLREYANLQSKKLAVMPYGTKLRVIDAESNPTMNISGIIGGMDQVEYNHKTGYAFNGYLSRFFPPDQDISAKGYALELNKHFPDVSYTEAVGGSVSTPTNTETISLPTQKWHEAFFIAKQLFELPGEFKFPKPDGNDLEIIKDSKPKKNSWVSELRISRKNNNFEKIEYIYSCKGFSKLVSITHDGDSMKISKTEAVN